MRGWRSNCSARRDGCASSRPDRSRFESPLAAASSTPGRGGFFMSGVEWDSNEMETWVANLEKNRDRKRVVYGKSVSVSVDRGGRSILKKNNNKKETEGRKY